MCMHLKKIYLNTKICCLHALISIDTFPKLKSRKKKKKKSPYAQYHILYLLNMINH